MPLPPPPGAALRPQQVQIAALHQVQAGADQANDSVTQIMRFPAATDRNACVAEQSRRDDAIGRAGKACIDCTKVQDQGGVVAAASADPVGAGAVGR